MMHTTMENLTAIEWRIVGLYRTQIQPNGSLPILTLKQIVDSGIGSREQIASALGRMCENRLLYCAGSVQWTDDNLFFLIGKAAEWAKAPQA